MPIATLYAFGSKHRLQSTMTVATVAAFAAGLTLWSGWQVRKGKWAHLDASNESERRDWNRSVFVVLTIGVVVTAAVGLGMLAIGLGCAGAIVGLAAASGSWVKRSQHVAFATLAVSIAGPRSVAAASATGAAIVAIAWSRRKLGRHTTDEVIAGFGAGLLAGVIFRLSIVALG